MSAVAGRRVRVERVLAPEDRRRMLAADVRAGLAARPRELPPKWFYDARGGELFEQITRLPAYYLTGAERSILGSAAAAIARRTEAETLVELGSGASVKTRLLLDALAARGTLRRFVGLDVDEDALRGAGEALAARYDGLEVTGLVADLELHLGRIPAGGRRLIAFLGSTIGNLPPAARGSFLDRLAGVLEPGDHALIGTDLVKPVPRLRAAYDDPAGVTAAFNRNVLAVIDRELDADFDPAAFEHVIRWDAEAEWIEMRLRARAAQRVTVAALGLTAEFAAGEELRTEISAKFRPARVAAELAAHGLEVAGSFRDPAGDFAVWLARPAG
jgi:L-histidine N-alpha-methyltransferase